ncbi:MAG: hypothetical protein EAZ97_15680 [Bacteroidetes bacterium]|nr:MAG: hypothetical protein EAZ97_15680 [Bacteroidota bacterium]
MNKNNLIWKIIVFIFIIFCFSDTYAQVGGLWKVLAKVQTKRKIDPKTKYEIEYPVFSEEVKALAGKTVSIKGYIIPLQELKNQSYFVLSSLPYNLCFFCGSAGPETVMEVNSKKKIAYTTEIISLKGKLRINDKDGEHLMYILDEAEFEK